MNTHLETSNRPAAGFAVTMLLSGMAGGMAWGIRGQYGHETGAMIAGVLVGFTLVLLHGRHLSSLLSARAVAMFALGISVGGSMTYGQTVGLTHDGPLIGNYDALHWGLIGLAVKGGVWIGLGTALFGMALSGKRYGPLELLVLSGILMSALFLGVHLLNQPFDPENKLLPQIYFSDHWYWEPDVDKPRRERWGGLVFVLATLLMYLGAAKRDWLGVSLGLWGTLGGAIGFPAGQSVQAFHAWNSEWMANAAKEVVFWSEPTRLTAFDIIKHFNWWNMMETTYGFVFGAIVGLGMWFHRKSIGAHGSLDLRSSIKLSPILELLLVAIHIRLLIAWNFQSIDFIDRFADLALPMIIIPMIAVMCGRYWPYLVSLPIVMLPIAGKTIRQLVFSESATAVETGWDLYIAGPLTIATLVAMFFVGKSKQGSDLSRWFAPIGLLTATWLYFGLNFAFFHMPWPWQEWTGRTPNGLIFLVCSVCLTLGAMYFHPRSAEEDT